MCTIRLFRCGSPFSARRLATLLLLLAALFLRPTWGQTRETLEFSVAAYDSLLSTLAPGEETAVIGDMLFDVEQLRQFRDRMAAKLEGRLVAQGGFDFTSSKAWTGGVIPYSYDKSMPESSKTLFESAIREWQENASLNFVPWTGQANYLVIKFTGYSNNAPMNSFIGMRGKAQTLNVAGWGNKIDCAHELGHALGMTHEQCRSDRDIYVRIIATNLSVNPATDVNYAIVPSSINRTDYDFDSLMHYPRDAFGNSNGLPNLMARAPYEKWSDGKGPEEIGQKTHLSAGDKVAMAAQYGAPLTIGGRILDAAGNPLAGVQVSLSGGATYRGKNPVSTDASGNYSFTGIPRNSGTYTISPSQPGTSFTEASRIAIVGTQSHPSVGFTSVDSAPPELRIDSPAVSGVYGSAPAAAGTASDSVGLKEVRVALARTSDLVWWNWNDNTWGSTTFDWAKNVRVASGKSSWSTALPSLAVGGYQVHVQSVDVSDNASAWLFRHFFVDPEPPVAAVTQPLPGSTVPELRQIRGTATDGAGTGIKDGRVYFTLYQDGDFWTGFDWKSNTSAQDPEVLLYADVVDGQWIYNSVPGGGHDHGSAAQDRHGTYYLSLFARDNAGNLSVPTAGVNSVEFTVDHSPPSISILTPTDGSTVTNIVSISGTAKDSKSLETVRLYLYRFSDGQFWDGTAWGGGGSAILPVTIDTNAGTWASSGPLPSNLTRDPRRRLSNGGYNIIAFAVDSAGNQTRSDAVVTVEYFMPVTFTAGSYSDAIQNNNNDLWDNPANWDTGFVPGPEDIAVIPAHSPTFSGTKTVHGLRQSGGEIRGGKIVVPQNGEFVWSGGTLATDVTIEYGASLRVTGTGAKVIASGRRMENHGSSEWDGASSISASGGVVFLNGGSLAVEGDITLTYYNNGVYPVGTFLNQGTMTKNGAGILRFSGDYGGWVFTNAASLNISEGSIVLNNENTHLGGTISGQGKLYFEGASLHLNSTTTLDGGTVELRSGTLRGGGTFEGDGTFAWTGGNIAGDIAIAESARLKMSERDRTINSGARIRNRGTALWNGGKIYTSGDSRFENSGRLDIDGEVSAFYYNNGVTPRGEFANTGLVTVNGGHTVTFANDYGGWHFNNNGETRVTSGKLVLGGGGASSNGVYEVQSGSIELIPSGERHVFSGGTIVRGAGSLRVTGAELIGESAAFSVAADSTLEHNSGRFDGSFSVEGPGRFVWSGGTLNAAMQWAPDLRIEISGSEGKNLQSGRIVNRGSVVWTGTGMLHAVGAAELRNEGTFEFRNDSAFVYYNNGVYPVGTFVNLGTLRKTIATNSSTFLPDYGGWAFVNNGRIEIQSGRIDLNIDKATLGAGGRIAGAGSLRIAGGNATVEGTNTLENGSIEMADGHITSKEGRIAGPGAFLWTGGRFSGALNLAVTNFTIAGPADKIWTSDSTLRNFGSATWTGGILRFTGMTFLENHGKFDAAADGSLYYYNNGAYPRGAIRNFGAFVKSAGTNATTLHNDYDGAHFHNKGSIEVQTGRLNLGGGGEWDNGVVVVRPGAELNLFHGSFQMTNRTVFTGAAAIRGAEMVLNNATNDLAANASLLLASGSLLGKGAFEGPGSFEWSGGRINGELRISPRTVWKLHGPDEKYFQYGAIENHGAASWSGSGPFKANGGARVNNFGSFAFLGDSVFTYYNNGVYPRGRFHNGGRLSKSGSPGETVFSDEYGGWEFSNDGTIQIDSGTLVLRSENYFTNSVIKGLGRVRVDGGAVHFAGSTALEGGTFDLSRGYVDGASTFGGAGVFEWRGGELRGAQRIAAGGRMLLAGGDRMIAGSSTLENSGTIEWTAGNIHGVGQSKLINNGTFELRGDAPFTYYNNGVYPVGTIENNGTIRKLGSTGISAIRGDYGGWTLVSPGTIEVLSGVLHIGGAFQSSASSRFTMSLGGSNPGTQYGRIEFPGTASLAGTLKIVLAPGYAPNGSDTFAPVTYGSRSGAFGATEFPPLPPGSAWALSYAANQAELKIAAVVEARNSGFSRTANGQFKLTLSGPPGQHALLQSSSNLVDWVNLQTNQPFSGEFQFADPNATNKSKFYRTVVIP